MDAWLTEKFAALNFRIAFDSAGEMNKLWMAARFELGIPTSFVVDRIGTSPSLATRWTLTTVLPKVLAHR
ncbi:MULTISPECIES: hypothetical protein [unclassified Rhizobium]|uniref:hypothetical protein n=1 Tax=unclassified Rhizobium TaxID=2613769 RepID=UPI00287F6EAA|nr:MULTISPECIES: hypothetical protein [unclassified Rhizobium]